MKEEFIKIKLEKNHIEILVIKTPISQIKHLI
jgi:hypothetical protein